MRGRRGTCSAAAPLTLLLIASTLGTTIAATVASTNIRNVRVYLAIAIFIYINIAYK